jgi:hypothetical protein
VVDTLPPSPADRVTVYLTIGAVGVTGVEVSSDEQDKTTTKRLSRKNNFLISVVLYILCNSF